jgi:hypothetical protein
MQNLHDPDSIRFQPVKHDVLSLLVPAKARTDRIA